MFWDRLQQALRRAERTRQSVLLVLLEVGEDEGGSTEVPAEAVQQLVCDRIRGCLRASDTLCQVGPRRIAIMLEDIRDTSSVPLVVEKIHATLVSPFRFSGRIFSVRSHTGAGLFPIDAGDSEQLWRQTRLTLERAIKTQNGAAWFSPIYTEHNAMERYELSRELVEAYRNKEFVLVFQEIWDAQQKRVTAIEALLRWQHPRRGLLSAGEFLDLLEDSGLIVPVGERVLNEACQFASSLASQGYAPVRVCVNVSERQLTDPGFVLSVLDVLYDTGIKPERLQLDVPEEVLATESPAARRALTEIGSAGVRIAVDQFGVGGSSLSELMRYPVTLVKVDRSLIQGIIDDPVAQAITSGLFAFARGRGLGIAAVGVEESIQAKVLTKMGCDELQGSYFSPALGAKDLVTRLAV